MDATADTSSHFFYLIANENDEVMVKGDMPSLFFARKAAPIDNVTMFIFEQDALQQLNYYNSVYPSDIPRRIEEASLLTEYIYVTCSQEEAITNYKRCLHNEKNNRDNPRDYRVVSVLASLFYTPTRFVLTPSERSPDIKWAFHEALGCIQYPYLVKGIVGCEWGLIIREQQILYSGYKSVKGVIK